MIAGYKYVTADSTNCVADTDEISFKAALAVDNWSQTIRAFAEELIRTFPWEQIRRAEESARNAARLEPKPMGLGLPWGRPNRMRPPRCRPPARFSFYQGAF